METDFFFLMGADFFKKNEQLGITGVKYTFPFLIY